MMWNWLVSGLASGAMYACSTARPSPPLGNERDFGVDLLCQRYKSTEILEQLSYRDVHLEIHARAPSSVLKSSSDRLGMSG